MFSNLPESNPITNKGIRKSFGIISLLYTCLFLLLLVVSIDSRDLIISPDNQVELPILISRVDVKEVPREVKEKVLSEEKSLKLGSYNGSKIAVPKVIDPTAILGKAIVGNKGNSLPTIRSGGIGNGIGISLGSPFGTEKGTSLTGNINNGQPILEEEPPILPTKKEVIKVVEEKPKVKLLVSGMVLNGKAISLPKPIYPLIARSTQVKGKVIVQVVISEDGNVLEAHIQSGHPLLVSDCLRVAKMAKFSPTFLTGKPVKVSGVIVYDFK